MYTNSNSIIIAVTNNKVLLCRLTRYSKLKELKVINAMMNRTDFRNITKYFF